MLVVVTKIYTGEKNCIDRYKCTDMNNDKLLKSE